MTDWIWDHVGWIIAFLIVSLLAIIICGAAAKDVRDNRCQIACNPARVVACERGASYCADGRMFWRQKGQP